MPQPIESVTVGDGKYTVIYDNGKLSALRYGERWRDLVGDNLVYAMMCRIQALEAEAATQAEQLQQAQAAGLPQAQQALMAMWKLTSGLVAKHGMDGDASLTDAEHAAWQEAGALANIALAGYVDDSQGVRPEDVARDRG